MIFIDAGAMFSLVVPSEIRHFDVEQWYLNNAEPLVTTDYCVDELLTLLLARKRATLAVSTGWKLFNEELCQLRFLTRDEIHRAWVVIQAQHRLGWSFTDCTSKVVIDSLGIRTAASLEAHFRQFGLDDVFP